MCKHCKNPDADFYASNKSKCKECVRAAVKKHRLANIDYYRHYDRLRPRRGDSRLHRQRNPEKYKARTAVSNAVRDGRLIKQPCSVCNSPRSTAHHSDYSKPLEVVWLCQIHHEQLHHEIKADSHN